MNKAFLTLLALSIMVNTLAQKFDIDTIVNNGKSSNRINLVILSDGYTSNELSKFITDAANFSTSFFNEIPFKNYKKYFNVICIKVPSNESGASHPGTATDEIEPVFPVISVDNYFGSTFDYNYTHRCLWVTKPSVVSSVLINNFPDYDLVLILVNSPYTGGSGAEGAYAVVSTNVLSNQIALHEFGHLLAGLKDEYWAGEAFAYGGPNMTMQNNPSLVRWKNWLGINGIGIYQYCCGGSSSLWYKPSQNCKMQNIENPFCSVCVQTIVEKIHSLTTPLEFYYPLDNNIIGTSFPLKFKLFLVPPEPNSLKRVWLLNGSIYKQNIDSISIIQSSLLSGTNSLKATIEDTTQLVRVDNHSSIHISSVIWSITSTITGIKEITSSSSEMIFDLYPNPTSGTININIQGFTKGNINLEIYDLKGKRLIVSTLYNNELNSIDVHNLDQGLYVARIFFDNVLITSRKIIKE